MLKFQNEFVKIELTNNSTVIKLTWQGLIPANIYMEGLDRALEIAIANEISEWNTDASEMLPISVACQDWVINDWFPRAVNSGYYKKQELTPPIDIAGRAAANRMVFLGKNDGVEFINTNYKKNNSNSPE